MKISVKSKFWIALEKIKNKKNNPKTNKTNCWLLHITAIVFHDNLSIIYAHVFRNVAKKKKTFCVQNANVRKIKLRSYD